MQERDITIRIPSQNEHSKFSIPNFMSFGKINISLEILVFNKYSGSFNFNFTAIPLEYLPFSAKILIHFKTEFVDIDKKLKFDRFNPSRSIIFNISSYMMKEMEYYVDNDITIQIEPIIQPYENYEPSESNNILNSINQYSNDQDEQSKINNNIYQNQYDQNNKKPKFNGLYNQGATCYINSAIQSMFHIPFFRRIVYKIHVNKENDQERSIITELQNLFSDLEHGRSTCSTKKLTNALGMNNKAVHVQQDIQEFVHFFTDVLDKIIEKNDEELKGKISYIFGGSTIQTIRNKDGEILSSNEENFNELIIDIGNSVDDSLMSYIKEETIDDYKDDKTGLVQTATIQTKILKLPRILQLLIKRYKYDPLSDQNVKDNRQMTFKNELDMSLFLFKNDPNICSNYTLFAVIVHEGSLSFGHYFVYLKPEMKDKWFFFSDTNVHQATSKQAIEDNFGGMNACGNYNDNYEWSNISSAYILIYVRNDAINEMFSSDESEVHSSEVKKTEAKIDVEKQKEESQITDNLIEFSIFNELCLIDNCEKGKPSLVNDSFSIEISVDLRSKAIELYKKVSEQIKLNINCIRLWIISKDYIRLKRIVDPSEFINQLRVQSLFFEIKSESEELFESKYIRTYFLILYTQIASKPFLFLRTRRYSLIERSSDLNGFQILKYSTIIEDATEILNSIFDSNLNDSDLNVYLASSKKALLQSPMSNCTEENGAIMIIRIDDNLISFTENLVNEIERRIGLKEKLKFITEKSSNDKKELTETPIYKYFDFVQFGHSNWPDEFFERRHNLKRAKVFGFDNVSKIVGIIEVPVNIECQELVNFIRVAFNIDQIDTEKESLLLFGRDEENKNFDFPRKKPLFESRFPFLDENLDSIYYCITPIQYAMDPSSETRIIQLSKDGHSVSKTVAYFMPKSAIYPFKKFYQINESFFGSEKVNIRMFIVNKNKEFGLPIVVDGDYDERDVAFNNENILRIEKVSDDQIGKELVLIYKAKIDKFNRIHEFGDPFYFAYIDNESLSSFQSRIWKFLGNQEKFMVLVKRPYYQENFVLNDFIHVDNQKVLYLIYDNK